MSAVCGSEDVGATHAARIVVKLGIGSCGRASLVRQDATTGKEYVVIWSQVNRFSRMIRVSARISLRVRC
jgi:hypothetical protein